MSTSLAVFYSLLALDTLAGGLLFWSQRKRIRSLLAGQEQWMAAAKRNQELAEQWQTRHAYSQQDAKIWETSATTKAACLKEARQSLHDTEEALGSLRKRTEAERVALRLLMEFFWPGNFEKQGLSELVERITQTRRNEARMAELVRVHNAELQTTRENLLLAKAAFAELETAYRMQNAELARLTAAQQTPTA